MIRFSRNGGGTRAENDQVRAYPSTLVGSYSLVVEPSRDERAWFRSPSEERWVSLTSESTIPSATFSTPTDPELCAAVDRAFRERRAWFRLSSRVAMPPVTLVRNIVPRFSLGPGACADSRELRKQCTDAAREIFARFGPAAAIAKTPAAKPPFMPALEAVRDGVPRDRFADCDMIALQPGYASTLTLLDALHEHGLDYRRLTFIGKSYSTHYGVARALLDRGATVPLDTLDQQVVADHEAVMAKAIRRTLDEYRTKIENGEAKRSLLVLDDGGLIAEIAHREYPDLLPRLKVVEQTTRGLRRLKQLEQLGPLSFPAARVGSAGLKLLEMPHVGLSAFWEVLRKLANLGETDPQKLSISVNGLGLVGMSVALAFARRGFQVRASDPDDARFENLHANITPIADRDAFLRGAEVLLSGTGTAPIKLADYRLLPDGAKLFNVASSNDELDAASAIVAARLAQKPKPWWSRDWKRDKAAYVESLPDLLKDDEYVVPETGWVYGTFGGMELPLGQYARCAQRDRLLQFADKVFYLASNGFVINHLTDCEDPIPARYIQPTRAALFIGCVEVMEHETNEAFDISPKRQKIAEDAYRADVGAEADDPKWLPDWVGHLRLPR